jgi:hypothetical protein
MKKHFGFIFAILALVALGLGGVVNAAHDSWSTQGEKVVPFSQSVTLGTTALVASAVTGRCHNVRTMTITDSASGVVRFYSTSSNAGANLIGAFAVIANTPLMLTEDSLRTGMCTRVGEALYVDAATGTLSIQLSDRLDLKSPTQ